MLETLSCICYLREVGSFQPPPKRGNGKSYIFLNGLWILHGLRFVLMEPNGGALLSAVQLEQPVDSPIYDRQVNSLVRQANRFRFSAVMSSAHPPQQ